MDKKLLIMCCSKRRPDRIQDMLKSYDETVSNIGNMLIYLHSDDEEHLPEYQKVLYGRNYIIDKPRYQAEVFNHITTEICKGYQYYGVINDDHICRTKDWDKELVDTLDRNGGWGIAHANDLWKGSSVDYKHPSCFVISSNIINHFGYMVLPSLRHFAIDDYLRDITAPLGILYFREDVVVEHMHAHIGKAVMDDNYKFVYSEDEMKHGQIQYQLWSRLYKPMQLTVLADKMQKDKENNNEKY